VGTCPGVQRDGQCCVVGAAEGTHLGPPPPASFLTRRGSSRLSWAWPCRVFGSHSRPWSMHSVAFVVAVVVSKMENSGVVVWADAVRVQGGCGRQG